MKANREAETKKGNQSKLKDLKLEACREAEPKNIGSQPRNYNKQ